MQIQIRTDHNIEGREALADEVSSVVEDALSGVSDRVTFVDVHLSNQNLPSKTVSHAWQVVLPVPACKWLRLA